LYHRLRNTHESSSCQSALIRHLHEVSNSAERAGKPTRINKHSTHASSTIHIQKRRIQAAFQNSLLRKELAALRTLRFHPCRDPVSSSKTPSAAPTRSAKANIAPGLPIPPRLPMADVTNPLRPPPPHWKSPSSPLRFTSAKITNFRAQNAFHSKRAQQSSLQTLIPIQTITTASETAEQKPPTEGATSTFEGQE
jgi:hypothetical protein